MNPGIWTAIGLGLGIVMWLVADNAVFIGAGLAIGIALGIATKSK